MARTKRPRAWWQEQLAALQASGLTHSQFAAQHGLHVPTLRHWLYAERKTKRREALPALVEVEWSAALAARPDVHATVAGVELRFSAGTDPAWLADLLARLGRAPC